MRSGELEADESNLAGERRGLSPFDPAALLYFILNTMNEKIEVNVQWLERVKRIAYDSAKDMNQTRRTAQYNLTGEDINLPEDPPNKPENPMLIHQAGIDESENVESDMRSVVCEISNLLKKV